MKQKPELKPCPFCGRKPEMSKAMNKFAMWCTCEIATLAARQCAVEEAKETLQKFILYIGPRELPATCILKQEELAAIRVLVED